MVSEVLVCNGEDRVVEILATWESIAERMFHREKPGQEIAPQEHILCYSTPTFHYLPKRTS